jgi:hypothetical protein
MARTSPSLYVSGKFIETILKMQTLIKIILILALVSCDATPSNKPKQEIMLTQKIKESNDVATSSKNSHNIFFEKYCNARFGYCIDYPLGIIYPQPESYNGDGRVFRNKQGEDILTVWGRNNSDPDFGHISIKQQFNDDLHGGEVEGGSKDLVITYQKLGKSFFVISGNNKSKIFYQKTIVKGDAFAFAILEYGESKKATFDKVSEHIFKSFN